MTRVMKSDFLAAQPSGRMAHLVLLNWSLPTPALNKLWDMSDFKVCADGGANRLYDHAGPSQSNLMHPNLILGDLDSLRDDVKSYYQQKQVPLLDLSHDQDSTDLDKCLAYLQANVIGPPSPQDLEIEDQPLILVLGAFGGRIDHTISNLNALYQFRHLNIVLWGEGNLVRLIRGPGEILIEPELDIEARGGCGLVCLGEPCLASSRGLKWDLKDTRLSIGGLLSTCNKILGKEVWVKTDKDLLWMTTVPTDWGSEQGLG